MDAMPAVLIVMGGGPGTMDALVTSLRREGVPPAVVLVVEAGGAAAAVQAFLATGSLPAEFSNFEKRLEDFEYIKEKQHEFAGELITPYLAADKLDIGSCVLSSMLRMQIRRHMMEKGAGDGEGGEALDAAWRAAKRVALLVTCSL